MAEKYGYVRVSSTDQNEARQMDAMEENGVPPAHIYMDKQSGKDFDRKAYRKLMRKLKEDDVLFIKSIDRLGRNYDEIQIQWNELKKKKVNIVVLDMPLLDTRQKIEGITGQFLADMVLQVLSYVAHVERDNIKQRQAEGIKSAMERGVQFGRPRHDVPDDFEYMCAMVHEKKISGNKAAKQLGIPKTTFFRKYDELYSTVEIKKDLHGQNSVSEAEIDMSTRVDNYKRSNAQLYYHLKNEYSISRR